MLCQSFGDIGEDATNEADTVTSVEFSDDGQVLATGDRGGRIVVFKSAGTPRKSTRQKSFEEIDENEKALAAPVTPLWTPYFQFQSHDSEFDYLKSLDIEERVNQIRFCKPIAHNLFILSTNDKTIKLWKISERQHFFPEAVNSIKYRGVTSTKDLPLPRPKSARNDHGISGATIATPRRVYRHAHAYHINSLSLHSDGETFLSADDVSVNLWNYDRTRCSFNVLDIKPNQMEENSEFITCASFHPTHSNLLAYSTTKGVINLCDMRHSATVDRRAVNASAASSSSPSASESPSTSSSSLSNESSRWMGNRISNSPSVRSFKCEDVSLKHPFSECLAAVSNFKFSHDGRYMVTRDYMTVKVWDVNMENKPVVTIPVHNHLRAHIPSLYESDAIYDKFEVFLSPEGDRITTGTYSNYFSIYKFDGTLEVSIQIPCRSLKDYSNSSTPSPPTAMNSMDSVVTGLSNLKFSPYAKYSKTEPIRIDQKILHGSWHPTTNIIAIAGQTGLFMYKI